MSLEALGAELQKAREKQKITLQRIAAETRISIRHLADLEQGSYDRLPGGMYNRAFLRSYCATIGLDPNPILERYEAALAPGDGPAKPKLRAEASVEYGRRVSPLIVWSGMLALSIVGLTSSRDWIAGSSVESFSLKLGNAGGLRARVNGKPARTLGAPGKIVTVLINRRNLEDFFDPASP